MSKVDEILKNAHKEKVEIPDNIKMAIFQATQKGGEEKKEMKKNTKKIAAICATLLLVTTAAYAGYQLDSLFRVKSMNDKGIQTALQNEYVQNIEMNYIEKEEVKFKVDYLLMDDINFDLVFTFETKDSVDNYDEIYLFGLSITDEQGNQIYVESEAQDIWSQNKALGGGSWSLIEKQDHTIRQVLHLSSNEFPRSEKIYVDFENVTLYKVGEGNATGIHYEDNYHLEFDVSDQLKNRITTNYVVQDTEKQDKIKDVKLTNSGLVMTLKTEREITKEDSSISLRTENGNSYYIADTMLNVDRQKKDYILGEMVVSFDITSYEATDTLTLVWNNEEITLVKE